MTEEERAAFRSFLLRRYVLSILALVLGIAGAVLLLRRGVDGPPLMEAVWVCLFVLSGGTAVLGGRAWGRYQTLLTEPEAMERTWQARRAGPQTEADQSYRRDVSRSGRLGLLLLAAALLLLLLGIPLQAQLTGRAADVYGQVIFCLFLVGFSMMAGAGTPSPGRRSCAPPGWPATTSAARRSSSGPWGRLPGLPRPPCSSVSWRPDGSAGRMSP